MSEFYSLLGSRRYDGPTDLVPISIISPEIRMATALPALDNVAKQISAELANKTVSEGIINEAREFVPEPVKRVKEILDDPLSVLFKAGVDFKNLDVMQVLRDTSEIDFEARSASPDRSEHRVAQGYSSEARARRREVQSLVHPDAGNEIVDRVMDEASQVAALGEVSGIEETAKDADTVNINFLKTFPAFFVELVSRELGEGKTFEQILEENPGIAEKAMDALYLSKAYLPLSKFDKTMLSPKDAENAAFWIRNEIDQAANPVAFQIIATAFAGMVTYARNGGVDTAAERYLGSTGKALVKLGGILSAIT